MSELERIPVRQESYDLLKQGVKNWIEQDLKWKREDIVSIHLKNEIFYNVGIDEKGSPIHKQGKHVDIILTNITRESKRQNFIRLDNGDWEKEGN